MKIVQISPCAQPYIAILLGDDDEITRVDVPAFGVVEGKKSTSAGPLIVSQDGDLVPAWSDDDWGGVEGYINCCPVADDEDDDFWLNMAREQHHRGDRTKNKRRTKASKASCTKKEQEEPEEPEDVDLEEDDDDDEPQGEVHLSGKKR